MRLIKPLDHKTASIADVRNWVVRTYSYSNKEKSDQFAGLMVHGKGPITIEEYEAPIKAFRCFSKYSYPIYFFGSDYGDMDYLIDKYKNINFIKIDPLDSLNAFSEFFLTKIFYMLPDEAENIVMQQSDGFLLKHDWEEFLIEGKIDYVGSPWPRPQDKILPAVKSEAVKKYNIDHPVYVGNGGLSFRKRSKSIEVIKNIDINDLDWDRKGYGCAEDVVFSYFGFGLGIFNSISVEDAVRWSSEPFMGLSFPSFGFHKTIKFLKDVNIPKHFIDYIVKNNMILGNI